MERLYSDDLSHEEVALVNDSPELSRPSKAAARARDDLQFVESHFVILPEVREALSKVRANLSLKLQLPRRVVRLDVKLYNVASPVVLHNGLPVRARRRDARENFREHPRADVAHPAHDHLVCARANLRDAAGEESAGARLFDGACDVGRAVAQKRHHLAVERRVNKLAVAFRVGVCDLEEKV